MIDAVGIVFAISVAAGGIFGYLKAGSVPSLIAGLVFGFLLAVGAYFNSISNPFPLFQIVVLMFLATLMTFRWIHTREFVPPGMIAVMTLMVLVWTSIVYRDYLSFGMNPVVAEETVSRLSGGVM